MSTWTKVPTPRGSDIYAGAITCRSCGETWQLVPAITGSIRQIMDANVKAADDAGWLLKGSDLLGTGLCPACR